MPDNDINIPREIEKIEREIEIHRSLLPLVALGTLTFIVIILL